MSIYIILIILSFLLLMSAAFSGSEAALFSISPWRLKRLEQEGSKAASITSRMLGKPEKLLIIIILGNETINSMISQSGAVLNRQINTDQNPVFVLYAALISAAALLIFGEITPKAIALRRPMRFIKVSRHIMYPWFKVSGFLASPLERITKRIVSVRSDKNLNTEEKNRVRIELDRYIALGEAEGAINQEEGQLLKSISSLDALTVRDVITPRHLLAAVDINTSTAQVLEVIHQQRHSRILVYDGNIDNIIGKVVLKDLMQFVKTGFDADNSIRNIVHQVLHVPDQINLRALLIEMQRRRETMAVIFDEYGGTLGLVTLEDIIEEVVGDIKDDKEEEKDVLHRLEDGSFIVKSSALLRDLEREIGFPKSIRFSGLHGYLAHLFGKIPAKGDTVADGKFRYEIISVNGQRINKVKISPIEIGESGDRKGIRARK
jgi:putative hemolysin